MGYRYIGSKARIADEIIEYVKETATMESGGFFVDAFSGTGVVAEKAAQIGWPVHVNDKNINWDKAYSFQRNLKITACLRHCNLQAKRGL